MLKLRKILLSNYTYYILIAIVSIIAIIRINLPKNSLYKITDTTFTGTITNYNINGNHLTIYLKNKETILGTYYFKTKKEINNFEKNLKVGDKIKVEGEFNLPNENTTKNLFNYRKYLLNRNIFYTINITNYKTIAKTRNIYYLLKQYLLKNINKNPYLLTFILGDKSYLSSKAINSFQQNGISHLFAISGMHISLLSGILLKILKLLKVSENKSYFITSIFLLIYLSLTGISPSILRGVLFFILFSINKIYYFYIKPLNIFIITLSVTLLINPYFIYDLGFQYSFLISLSLLMTTSYLKSNNYLLGLLKTSLISFLVSIPISLYNFYQINILSIIYNLFFVPLVSMVVFPLSLLTTLCPFLLPVYNISTSILEQTSIYISKISLGKLIFPKVSIIVYILYFLLIFYLIKNINNKNQLSKIILLLILIAHYLYPTYSNKSYLKMIDVGQGDSILLHSNNESILIDTGGIMNYSNEAWQKSNKESSIVRNTTIPLLKSLGIKKLKYLILTHGDADHMGEAKYLIDNFKVENIIINSGKINYLEKEIIKKRKDVVKGYEGLQISCGDFELIQLNEKYQDENIGSQIYYATNGNINILLTGDASIESELNLLEKYDLPEMDILKVGHHGSKTSSNKKFINTIKPKYSLISCGKDNKFNHPNDSVLETLKESKIYRTDEDGSVTFKIEKSKLEIETYSP